MPRIITIVSEGEYPKINQQAQWSNYPKDRETMAVAEDLRFFIENKIKAQP